MLSSLRSAAFREAKRCFPKCDTVLSTTRNNQSYSVLKYLALRVFDFHSNYDIMVTKEIITVHKDFHKSFAQCFVSEVRLAILSN